MAKNRDKKKQKLVNVSEIDKKQKINKLKIPKSKNPPRPTSNSDSESESEKLQKLLEPYSKDQLVTLAVDTALSHPSLLNLIKATADTDITHRKIFVHGLGSDTTNQTLQSLFEPFGEIEVCNVVSDRVDGKAKGYAFVVFKTRKSATKALKQPHKRIGNRVASCQLASLGPPAAGAGSGSGGSVFQDLGSRKIYVNNVPHNANADKLRTFFAKFGEIEVGPMGFDPDTGKSKGYALFVYKTAEEAKKCLEEPYKMFEGRQLHCQKAAEGKFGKGGAASITTAVVQQPAVQQPLQWGQGVYPAVAAAQNMAMLGQNPNAAFMNPMYSGFLGYPNAGYVNPYLGMGGYGQGVFGLGQVGQLGGGMGVAGYGGMLGSVGGSAPMLGTYGSGGGGGGSSTGGPSVGVATGVLPSYPTKQVDQSTSPARPPRSTGYSSHL